MTDADTRYGYRDVRPHRHPLARTYLSVMLWFVGRAVVAATRVDPAVRAEWDALPEGYVFRLGVMPDGPAMVVGKRNDGSARVIKDGEGPVDLDMRIKSVDGALRMFTFRESTAVASCRNRIVVDGEVPPACGVVRILDAVEMYLLPAVIARRAVKRLPDWSLYKLTVGRLLVYLRTVSGL